MFLAGDPVDWSAGVPERLSVSEEMAAVRSAFVGPGLRMVQGNALLADEFEGEPLAAADLVHLALPARIDLAQPENAAMELSEPGRGAGRQALLPANIRSWKLAAPLVVLGQTEMANTVDSVFASRLGLVSDWLDAGAEGVLVCHPNESSAAASFLQGFYRELARGRPVTAALRTSAQGDSRAPSCQLYRR